jgi:hypothetical protein
VDQQAAQIAVAALADPEQDAASAARVLVRHQPQPCTQLAPTAKLSRVADCGYQRGGGQRTNFFDRHQTTGPLIGAGEFHDPLVVQARGWR